MGGGDEDRSCLGRGRTGGTLCTLNPIPLPGPDNPTWGSSDLHWVFSNADLSCLIDQARALKGTNVPLPQGNFQPSQC